MAKKRGRPKNKARQPKNIIENDPLIQADPVLKAILEKPIKTPDPPKEVQTPEIPEIEDRMLRYSPRTSQTSMRNKPRCCPECQAMPVVTVQRRRHWAVYRCRECGHRWEVGKR